MERPADNAEDGNALQNSVLTKVRELDHLIQEAGKLLTSLTNYASVAITPAMTQIAIRQFEIIAVDKMNFEMCIRDSPDRLDQRYASYPSAPAASVRIYPRYEERTVGRCADHHQLSDGILLR